MKDTMKAQSFGPRLLVVTCLILHSGLAFGQNADKSAPNARPDKSEPDNIFFNPLSEMLGLGEPLMPEFDDTASEIAKNIQAHQEAMDKAMDIHQKAMRDTIDNVMGQHNQQMDFLRSQFKDFDRDFKNFDKNFDQFYKPMEEEFERLAAPLRPHAMPDRHQSEEPKPIKSAPVSESPDSDQVPNDMLSRIITTLVHPVIRGLETDIEKSLNDTERELTGEKVPPHVVVDQDFEIIDNQTDTNQTDSSVGIVTDFLSTIVGSLCDIFCKNSTQEETNDTKSSFDEFELVDAMMQDESKDKSAASPKSIPEDDYAFASELDQMASAIEMHRDGGPLPFKFDRLNSLNKLIEIENQLEARLRKEWNVDDRPSGRMPPPVSIENKLRHEIKIVTKEDKDYEWYDWALVGLIAATSTLLFLMAIFIGIQKVRRAKGKVFTKNTEEGSVRPKTDNQTDCNGIPNDNLSNKYKEKIKTIFVNLN